MGGGTGGGAAVGEAVAGEGGGGCGRRSVLHAAVLGGGAVALGAAGAAGGLGKAVAATQPPFRLFTQEDLNFETLFTLGGAGYGISEVGEVVTTVNRINAAGASYQAYYGNFLAMARDVDALAGQVLVQVVGDAEHRSPSAQGLVAGGAAAVVNHEAGTRARRLSIDKRPCEHIGW